jgi:ABC-type xylose transport system permease subunit
VTSNAESTSARPTSNQSTAPTPSTAAAPSHRAEPSIGSLVADAHASFSTLLHGEIELAKLEVKSSVKHAGTGAGMFGAAAVLLIFSLTFGLIALAEGLVALHLWRWVAYLIVFGFLVLLAGLLIFIGIRKVKRVRAPRQTIDTTKSTVSALKKATSSNPTPRG